MNSPFDFQAPGGKSICSEWQKELGSADRPPAFPPAIPPAIPPATDEEVEPAETEGRALRVLFSRMFFLRIGSSCSVVLLHSCVPYWLLCSLALMRDVMALASFFMRHVMRKSPILFLMFGLGVGLTLITSRFLLISPLFSRSSSVFHTLPWSRFCPSVDGLESFWSRVLPTSRGHILLLPLSGCQNLLNLKISINIWDINMWIHMLYIARVYVNWMPMVFVYAHIQSYICTYSLWIHMDTLW